MLFDCDDDEDESENILDDSEIRPQIEYNSSHGKCLSQQKSQLKCLSKSFFFKASLMFL